MLGYGDLKSIEWICGGAVISERFILTAGHCVSKGIDNPVTYAVIGILRRRDANDQTKVYKVEKFIKHPEYKSPSQYNDIALIQTDRVMQLDQFTVPACLHTGDAVNDEQVIAAGWGFTDVSGKKLGDILQRVVLSKFPAEECSSKYRAYRLMTQGLDASTMSCYGDKDPPQWYKGSRIAEYKDTCEGDSGSPIQIKNEKINCMYTIVGVTSIGKSCGRGAKPGIYTRVAHYLPWIESIVWPSKITLHSE